MPNSNALYVLNYIVLLTTIVFLCYRTTPILTCLTVTPLVNSSLSAFPTALFGFWDHCSAVHFYECIF